MIESKLNNDLQFNQTDPSIFDPKIINKNYWIIDAFHLLKKNKQEKHVKKYDNNGMATHRRILFCKKNIKCNRNNADNLWFLISMFDSLNNYFLIISEGGYYIFYLDINA